MTKILDFEKAFLIKIQALYDIEKQLEKILSKMAKACTDLSLKQVLASHQEEVRNHSLRLEKIFEMLGVKPRRYFVGAIRGIVADVLSVLEVDAPDEVKDCLIAEAGRCFKHYEIACYRNALEAAQQLGFDQFAIQLSENLIEEKRIDEKLEIILRQSRSPSEVEEAID